ncbi:hypothetical protein GQ457_16G015480 [Hibiscus cannabinus]
MLLTGLAKTRPSVRSIWPLPLSLFVSSRTRAALHLVTRNFCFGDLYSFNRETDDLPPPPVQTAPARTTRAPREYYFRLDLNLLDLLEIIKVIDLFAVRARPLESCNAMPSRMPRQDDKGDASVGEATGSSLTGASAVFKVRQSVPSGYGSLKFYRCHV